jgi:predicted patatin/cPLA2 family phospholipase
MKKYVIVLTGGAMLGTFGGGIVTSFEKNNIYSKIDTVYGISAGAHNAAYFLAKQTDIGSSVYYTELTKNFICSLRRYFSHLFSKSKYDYINIEYLINIENTTKKLNEKNIIKSKIPFFVLAYNLDLKKHEFIKAKKEIVQLINASGGAQPFYTKSIKIGKYNYIDENSINYNYIKEIIKRHPDKKIIFIFNYKIKTFYIQNFLFEIIQSVLIGILFGFKIFLQSLKSIFKYNKKINKKNIYYIENKINVKRNCTNKDKLYKLYLEGVKTGDEIVKKIIK